MERGESKMLSLIFLLAAFHKAGKIIRITPNLNQKLLILEGKWQNT